MATKIEDTATPGLNEYEKKVVLTLKKVMTFANEETVKELRHLQLNSGSGFFWTNRTKKAGKSLAGRVKYEDKKIISELGHGKDVPYGFFLETNKQGRYGFLSESMKFLKSKTLIYLKRLGFEFDFSIVPYKPKGNDRTLAQRKNKRERSESFRRP